MSAAKAGRARRWGFTMVHDGVTTLLRECRASGTEICVLLELMRYQREDGTFSRPRADVADALDMTENSVSLCVSSMLRKGVISIASRGHNGRTAVYRLMCYKSS